MLEQSCFSQGLEGSSVHYILIRKVWSWHSSFSFFFFLLWTTFKVLIEFVTILLLLFSVLGFWPWGMWNLNSLTPCTGRWGLNHWTTILGLESQGHLEMRELRMWLRGCWAECVRGFGAKKDHEISWNNLERSLEAVDEVLGHDLYLRGKSQWDPEREARHSKLLPMKGQEWSALKRLSGRKQLWMFKKNLFPCLLIAVTCQGPHLAFYPKCFYSQSSPATQVRFSDL